MRDDSLENVMDWGVDVSSSRADSVMATPPLLQGNVSELSAAKRDASRAMSCASQWGSCGGTREAPKSLKRGTLASAN